MKLKQIRLLLLALKMKTKPKTLFAASVGREPHEHWHQSSTYNVHTRCASGVDSSCADLAVDVDAAEHNTRVNKAKVTTLRFVRIL